MLKLLTNQTAAAMELLSTWTVSSFNLFILLALAIFWVAMLMMLGTSVLWSLSVPPMAKT